jgi:hypothetical protein
VFALYLFLLPIFLASRALGVRLGFEWLRLWLRLFDHLLSPSVAEPLHTSFPFLRSAQVLDAVGFKNRLGLVLFMFEFNDLFWLFVYFVFSLYSFVKTTLSGHSFKHIHLRLLSLLG